MIPPAKEQEPEKEYPFLTGTGSIDINKSGGDDPSIIYKLNMKIQIADKNSVTIEKSSDRNQEGAHPITNTVKAEVGFGEGNTWKVQVTDGPTGPSVGGELNLPVTINTSLFMNGSTPMGGGK